MVDVFGNNIVSAYTGGVPVVAIYNNGVKVWPTGPEPGDWYIRWTPTNMSGTFYMFGSSYQFQDYNGYFTWEGPSGFIPSTTFELKSFTYVKTDVTRIENQAFWNCPSLSSISLPECQYIGSRAFESTPLKSVYLPKCSYIDGAAFATCSSLSSISLPECEYIGSGAFEGTPLKSVYLPKCSYIDFEGFGGCYSLSLISLPECQYIGSNVFYRTRIKTLSLPECSYVGESAFMSCYSLSSVSLPKCGTIEWNAFNNCSSLKYVTIPACSYIGPSAFYNCSEMVYMILGGSSVCTLANASAMYNTNPTSIYVPASLLNDYKTAQYWSSYSNRMLGYIINN